MENRPWHESLTAILGWTIALISFFIIKKVIFPIKPENVILTLEIIAVSLLLSPIAIRELDALRKIIVGKIIDHKSLNLREIVLVFITVGASILMWWGGTILSKTSTATQ